MHSFGLILTKHSVAIYNMIMSTFAEQQHQKKHHLLSVWSSALGQSQISELI